MKEAVTFVQEQTDDEPKSVVLPHGTRHLQLAELFYG